MKKYNFIYHLFLLGLLAILFSCEEDDLERFVPPTINTDEGVLTYVDLVTYPLQGNIVSNVPELNYEGNYAFLLDSIAAPLGSTYQRNSFSIDRISGAITYNNAGELSPGLYAISVGISTVTGIVIFEDAVKMEVLEVPVDLTIDNAVVEAGALQVGVIASLTYNDISGGDISEVSYEFVEPKAGFAINSSTGEISKAGLVVEPSITFSIRVITNLGISVFENVLTVNVGEAPALNYLQQDGATDLTKVSLSPWTAYTTSAPQLSGMEAGGGFEAILPEALLPYASAFSFDAEGRFSIANEVNLPDGEYNIGVIATNSGGVSATFENLFVLNVETIWDTNNFIEEDFTDNTNVDAPQNIYPGLWSGHVFGGNSGVSWVKVSNVAAGSFSGMRVLDPKDTDAGLIRTIDLTDVFGLRLSFGEMLGYGGPFINNYNRALYFGDDISNASANTFVASDWTALMDVDGAWLGPNWNGGNGPAQGYSNILVDLSQVDGNTLYIMWRVLPTAGSSLNQNGQWIIDNFSAQKASAYSAIEE